MLGDERKAIILELLKQNKLLKNKDILDLLDISESSLRRDLVDLEQLGLLVRVHGGISLKEKLFYEPSINEKSTKNIQEKIDIAQKAAKLIASEDILFIDAGTSTAKLVEHINELNIHCTVVTNSVKHASILNNTNIETIIIGGKLKKSTEAVVGAFAISQMDNYRFDAAFLGINGVDIAEGFTTPDMEEAMIKKAAIKKSRHTYFLADASKFEQMAFVKVADLSQATIITSTLTQDMQQTLAAKTNIL